MESSVLTAQFLPRLSPASRARGVIFGSALGDALGLYTEFLTTELALRAYPDRIIFGETPLTGDFHRDKFQTGSWTDDTDQALLLVLAALYHYGNTQDVPDTAHLAQDFAIRLHCWCEQGLLALSTPRLGLGQTIATVALSPEYLENPAAMATKIWNKSSPKNKPASNGSLMRAHPLGILACTYEEEVKAFELAVTISRVTHADPRCSLACCVLVAVLRLLLRGELSSEQDLDDCISRTVSWAQTIPTPMFDGIETDIETNEELLYLEDFHKLVSMTTTYDILYLDEAYKIGHIYKCLGAGIYVLRQALREASEPSVRGLLYTRLMMDLVMRAGDADTNATVAGALLGAYVGETGLSQAWIQKLAHSQWLQHKAVRFVSAAGIPSPRGSQSWQQEPKDIDADVHGGREPLTKEQLEQRDIALLEMTQNKRKVWERQRKQSSSNNTWTTFTGLFKKS